MQGSSSLACRKVTGIDRLVLQHYSSRLSANLHVEILPRDPRMLSLSVLGFPKQQPLGGPQNLSIMPALGCLERYSFKP